jgi:hypothetical protein
MVQKVLLFFMVLVPLTGALLAGKVATWPKNPLR